MTRNRHEPAGFNAQQLFEFLSQFTPEERADRLIYFRIAPVGLAFNITTIDYVEDSTCVFFGQTDKCLIFNPEEYSPKEEINEISKSKTNP